MTQEKGWLTVTAMVVVTLTAIIGGICVTAVRFAEAPNSFQMDLDAQPNHVQIRARVQSKAHKTLLTEQIDKKRYPSSKR